ncbi:hypothetical protein CC1G_01908 [Coprinopsis cinerea okayama7|uniref:Uncharacterized protein n=1 Tax=Coprinopsis cinerea (strain Okayama-7 / 130 / ATCC MYA-4618 / FGSC 9003) TaxID=240176 RepID=A8N5X7_COPC7|nr:hypothetical protein CC1G_01908 [Coprinopsis cinerea okayama7\|eukprot:XP_001830272.2 hypothetical protein CC1G_01908 [Coprinopsis cinerea okayama7\
MEPLSAVLRVENGTGGPFDVRQLLARCGEMYVFPLFTVVGVVNGMDGVPRPLLYPFNGGSAGSAVYFLKFSTEERAAVAQQLGSKTPGISITAIHNSAEWISHFRLASSTGNLYPGSGTPSNDYDPLRKVHGNPFHGSGLTVPDSMPGNAHNDLLFPAYPSSSSTPLSLAAPLCQVDSHPVFGTGNCYPFSFTSNPIDLASKPPLTSSDLLKAGLTYPHSLETSVLMDLRSGIVAYDLERLEDDPASAIHLLKLTKSDIHIWMVIAAHYRRTKRPLAAIEVVFAMMEGGLEDRASRDRLP